jgi:antitoxin component YwqK of YwqJK toxin-antitoxin module
MNELLRINWNDLKSLNHEFDVYKGELFTGIAEELYPNGSVWSEAEFVNGIRHGKAREWYENGQLKSENYYQLDNLNGISKEWYENGQLNLEENIFQSICLERKVWDESGELIEHFTINETDPNFEFYQMLLKKEAEWQNRVKNWTSKRIRIEDLNLSK